MTTGKNKEEFEKWLFYTDSIEEIKFTYTGIGYYGDNQDVNIEDVFYSLPFEMQIGVYEAYYDSLGYKIYTMGSISDNQQWSWSIWMDGDFEELIEEYNFKTRNEAQQEAFKKANELLNEKLK